MVVNQNGGDDWVDSAEGLSYLASALVMIFVDPLAGVASFFFLQVTLDSIERGENPTFLVLLFIVVYYFIFHDSGGESTQQE